MTFSHYALAGRRAAGIVAGLAMTLGLVVPCAAETTRLIPFQARLTDAEGQRLPDGVHGVTFRIYLQSEPGTGASWTEVHSDVPVTDGLVNVLLGSLTPLDDPDDNGDPADGLPFGSPLFVSIAIDGGEEMVPRHQIVPAFHAYSADVVGPLGVGPDAVKPGAIGPETLASDAGVPVGAIIMWWGNPASLPYGFELCDGTAPKPGSLLGGTKPDLTGRFPRGVPSGGTTTQGGSDTIGVGLTTGGTALQSEQIPSHTHAAGALATGGAGTHTHTFTSGCTQSTGSGQKVVLGAGTSIACPPTDSPGNHTHAVTGETGATGGIPGGTMPHTHQLTDSDISILPKYQNLYFIIRVK